MRRVSAVLGLIGCLQFAAPTQACVQVTPAVRAWAQCGYKVAAETGDHKFMVNFAEAKERDSKLLPTAKPRWRKLETRIAAKCGAYARAAASDQKNLSALRKSLGAVYVPENQFTAIFDTSDIDKLVKTNA